MFNSDWVSKKSKVKITFEDGTVHESTGDDDIIQVDYDVEICKDNTDPIGVVSANRVYIKLKDSDKRFVKTNKESPYFGLLNDGFKIESFVSVDSGAYEPTGVYYATDLKNNTSNGGYNTVLIGGADILQYIGNVPVMVKMVYRNITVGDYLDKIFKSVGLSSDQYNIANTLTERIKYAYGFGIKLKDILNTISKSYMCNIYVDYNGVIQVIDLLDLARQDDIEFEFNGNDTTFKTEISNNLLDTYNAVRVKYSKPYEVEDVNLMTARDIEVPIGTLVLSNYNFSDGYKALSIKNISIKSEDEEAIVYVDSYTFNQNDITMEVVNESSSSKKVTIEVYGDSIVTNTANIEKKVAGITEDKLKYIEVESEMIQDETYADEYCDILLRYLSSDNAYVELEAKGHPLLPVGILVDVKSDILGFDATCILSRLSISSGLSYTCRVSAINVNALRDN